MGGLQGLSIQNRTDCLDAFNTAFGISRLSTPRLLVIASPLFFILAIMALVKGLTELNSHGHDNNHNTQPIIDITLAVCLILIPCIASCYPLNNRAIEDLESDIREMIEADNLQRRDVNSFRENTNTIPKYFCELAVKLHAKLTPMDLESQIDTNARNIFNILGQFSNASTSEGNEFRQFLFDQDHAYMLECVNRLLSVEVDTTDDNQPLTLKQSLESNGYTIDIILDCVDTLRESLGHTRWTWATDVQEISKIDDNTKLTQVQATLYDPEANTNVITTQAVAQPASRDSAPTG
jgi:hypothetical protein